MKKLLCLLCVLLLSVGCAAVASAEMSIKSMDINVSLRDDGSAVVEQVWETYADENTEFYYPFGTGKYLSLSEFSVGDKTKRAYQVVEDWDVEASFEEKAYTCGLLPIDGGYEVCFGVSRYGENRYTIRYVVHNMVGSYNDADGFLFRFVNSEMNTTPTTVNLAVEMEDGTDITDKICNIWAFGYDGDIWFSDNGRVYAKTASPLQYNNHVTLMFEFKKDILHPSCKIDGSFADVKTLAFENSDYDPNAINDNSLLIFAAVMGVLLAVFGIALTVKFVHRVQAKKFIKACDYYRDLPLSNDLNAAAKLGAPFAITKEESLIGAYLLRMINNGNIRALTAEEVKAFGVTKKNTDLLLVSPPQNDAYAKQLYDILEKGADENHVITQSAMKKLCRTKYMMLRGFLNVALSAGERTLDEKGYSDKINPTAIGHLSDSGKQYLSEVAGFRKYLEEFSLLDEHEIGAASIWQEYMVWAVLFGIADKVIKELRHLYPAQADEWDMYDRRVIITRGYYHGMYHSMRTREQEIQAQRSAGSGGKASFGGGGGFSGGGIGGGGR